MQWCLCGCLLYLFILDSRRKALWDSGDLVAAIHLMSSMNAADKTWLLPVGPGSICSLF